MAKCKNTDVYLDESGLGFLDPVLVDNGSADSDPCTFLSFELDRDEFICNQVGIPLPVTLKVSDSFGNEEFCSAFITVIDTTRPQARCSDINIILEETGSLNIIANQIDNGSTDECYLNDLTLSKSSFDCNDLGDHVVILTVRDQSLNMDTCHARVHVSDTIAPTAVCQDVTITLDGSGSQSLAASQIDAGSSDNCQIQDLSLDMINFDCDDLGAHTVVLSITDVSNNMDTCHAMVTVQSGTNNACEITCADCLSQPENTWTGALNNDWHEAGNWSLNVVPSICHQVIIVNGTVVIYTGQIAACYTLSQDQGAILDQELGSELIIGECLD
jgi:hypothetical protein